MKIEIFDSYNIRARVCPCIILLSPIAITLFICFRDIFNATNSAIIILLLLSFANCIPIIQRIAFERSSLVQINYAARFLDINDDTIDVLTKKRYYKTLVNFDPIFEKLDKPAESLEYKQICESAIKLIKTKARENKLLLEENINYGFSKNMLINKGLGIIICCINIMFISVYSVFVYKTVYCIPRENWIALVLNIIILFFWIFIINRKTVKESAKRYALALIESIDNM